MKMKLRVISALTAGMLALSSSAAAFGKATTPEALKLPIVDKPLTITWFVTMSTDQVKNYADQEDFVEMAKRTGIKIDFQHPPAGTNANEQLNLIVASNSFPDVIHWNWASLPGGITKYISSGIALKLNDLINSYAPNYLATLGKYPQCKKAVLLDDGTIPAFYQLDPDPRRLTYNGFVMRGDWLEKLKLSEPVTINDWYKVLTAFKQKDPNGNGKQDEIPWSETKDSFQFMNFAAAYGILDNFYRNPETGKVAYGPLQPAYKEFLTTMAQWYKEGLIDSEFATNDSKMFTSKIQGDLAGATFGAVGGVIGNNITAARPKVPGYSLVGMATPQGAAKVSYSTKHDFLMTAGHGTIITKSAKNTKEITKLIDYMYTEEGQTLLNWGIEGKSYTVVDGKKTFTDEIFKNKDGKAPNQAIAKYSLPTNGWPKVMDFEPYSAINLIMPEQRNASDKWAQGDYSLLLSPNVQYAPEESATLGTILNDVNTYKNEMVLKFVMGIEPMTKYDDFLKTIKNMKIENAVKITQDAYDRFDKRK